MSSDLEKQLADALHGIYRRLDLVQDELLQLSPKELTFLLIVEDLGECRVKDLAAKVNLPLSTVSWTADKMVTKGYISRRPDPTDRRAIILKLAKQGEKALGKHREIFDNIAAMVVANLPEDEATTAVNLIRRVYEFFQV